MHAALVALALVVPAADPPKEKEKELPEAAKKDLNKLEGVWKAAKTIKNGEETGVPAEELATIEFKGRKLLWAGQELFAVTGLDPTTDPKCIDLKTVMEAGPIRKGMVFEGIYKLDGNNLTIALHEEGGTRPFTV